MIALESPIHALVAYKYFNDAGILTAVTWAAVLTAAVSFWKIIGVSISSPRSSDHDLPAPPPVFNDAPETPAKDKDSQSVVHAAAESYCGGGNVKGKFRLCFVEEDCYREGDEWRSREEEDDGVVCRNFEYGGDWERRARRMVDMGWYRNQDLRMLDGSVVRLWDQSIAGVRL